MAEIYVGTKHGEFGLEDWEQLMARFPKHADRAIASAVKSEGYRMQKMIKAAIQQGGPEGHKFQKLSPHYDPIRLSQRAHKTRQAKLDAGKNARRTKWQKLISEKGHIEGETPLRPLRKLAGATRYIYDDSIKTATVGFLDQKKRGLGKMHAAGFKIQVTDRMRRMLFAAGMPLKKGTNELDVPARPVVAPVFEREKKTIINNIKNKTLRNIYRYLTGKGKAQVEEEWKI